MAKLAMVCVRADERERCKFVLPSNILKSSTLLSQMSVQPCTVHAYTAHEQVSCSCASRVQVSCYCAVCGQPAQSAVRGPLGCHPERSAVCGLSAQSAVRGPLGRWTVSQSLHFKARHGALLQEKRRKPGKAKDGQRLAKEKAKEQIIIRIFFKTLYKGVYLMIHIYIYIYIY
jgi:hypothetical protein